MFCIILGSVKELRLLPGRVPVRQLYTYGYIPLSLKKNGKLEGKTNRKNSESVIYNT